MAGNNPLVVQSFSPRFDYSATVTLTAPNPADLAAIKVGFVQTVRETEFNALYFCDGPAVGNAFYVNGSGTPMEGHTFLDSYDDQRKPWVIAPKVQAGAFASTAANQQGQPQTIGWHDQPNSSARRTCLAFVGNDWLPTRFRLVGFHGINNFELNVAATLANAEPSDPFWTEGYAQWATNLSYSYVLSGFGGTATQDPNFGLTRPNAWTIPGFPQRLQTDLPIAADAIAAGRWRISVS